MGLIEPTNTRARLLNSIRTILDNEAEDREAELFNEIMADWDRRCRQVDSQSTKLERMEAELIDARAERDTWKNAAITLFGEGWLPLDDADAEASLRRRFFGLDQDGRTD